MNKQIQNQTIVASVFCTLHEKEKLVRVSQTEMTELKEMMRLGICGSCYERLGGHKLTFPQSESDY